MPSTERQLRCKNCAEPLASDGYGDWIHWDGYYMCEGKEGEVATP